MTASTVVNRSANASISDIGKRALNSGVTTIAGATASTGAVGTAVRNIDGLVMEPVRNIELTTLMVVMTVSVSLTTTHNPSGPESTSSVSNETYNFCCDAFCMTATVGASTGLPHSTLITGT